MCLINIVHWSKCFIPPVTAVSSANMTSADLDNSLLLVRVQAYLKWHLYRWRFALFFVFTPQNFKKWFPLWRLNNIFFIKFRNIRKKHTTTISLLDSILPIYHISNRAIFPSPAAFQKPTKTSHVATLVWGAQSLDWIPVLSPEVVCFWDSFWSFCF